MSNLTLRCLSVYNTLVSCVDIFSKSVNKFYCAVSAALEPAVFVFFDKIPHPYLRNLLNPEASTSAKPLWRYTADTHTFVAWNGGAVVSMPIFSMEVVEDGKMVYDLTDFLETVRVYGESETPSVAHIVQAWSLSSGIVLNPARKFFIRYINEEADTVVMPLYGDNPLEAYDDIDVQEVSTDLDKVD